MVGIDVGLLLTIQIVTTVVIESAPRTTMWVTPATDLDLCANRTGPCKTLTQFRDENMLNRSNVDWRFLSGPTPHMLSGGLYVFKKVSNVSLVCEDDNYQGICQIHCNLTPGGEMCAFVFKEVKNVSITRFIMEYRANSQKISLKEALNISEYLNSSRVCKTCHHSNYAVGAYKSWVFVDSMDVTVSSVEFIGPQQGWAVISPSGRFTVKNCSFTNLSSGLLEYDPLNASTGQHHIVIVIDTLRQSEKEEFFLLFEINRSIFKGINYLPTRPINGSNFPVVHVVSENSLNGRKVKILIHNCCFERCPALQVTALEDPGLNIIFENNNIDGNVTKGSTDSWVFGKTSFFNGSAIRIHLHNSDYTKPSNCSSSSCLPHLQCAHTLKATGPGNIRIANTNFREVTSSGGSGILFRSVSDTNCLIGVVVTVEANTFAHNHGILQRSVLYGEDTVLPALSTASEFMGKCSNDALVQFRLIMRSNQFVSNFNEIRSNHSCIVFRRPVPNLVLMVGVPEEEYYKSCHWQMVISLKGYSPSRRVLLENNIFEGNKEGGIELKQTTVQIRGNNTVSRSRSFYGGGFRLDSWSQLLLEENIILNISHNRAFVNGGGFYIHENTLDSTHTLQQVRPCFFQFAHRNGTVIDDIKGYEHLNRSIILSGNMAGGGRIGTGSIIFNSGIDKCVFKKNSTRTTTTLNSVNRTEINRALFSELFNSQEGNVYKSSEISSVPRKICKCREGGGIETCDLENEPPKRYYPGERLKLHIVILGDMDIPLGCVLFIELERSRYKNMTSVTIPLHLLSTHVLDTKCNTLNLPPLPETPSRAEYYYLQLRVPMVQSINQLTAESPYLSSFLATEPITSCPDGFYLMQDEYKCKCHRILEEHGIQCLLDEQAFVLPERDVNFWIGYSEQARFFNRTVIVWSHKCAQGFCVASDNIAKIPSNNYSIQCRHSRTGVLCGQCPSGLSVVVGSNICDKCTHWSLLLLLLVLIGGPLFVILIGALNMTITAGAINGYIFYISVIAINSDELQANQLTVYRVCMYNGMNEFGKTLLSYLIPLYFLVLVAVACCLPKCRCIQMHKIHKAIGPRITPVLATVITCSYLLLIYTTIKSFAYATVYSTDGSEKVVWLFDGSLEYFQSPQHIVLGVMATVTFLFFLLPAAVVATFGDLLRRFIKGPYYMNFLDTFHGAFRFRFGFWFGVRLIILTLLMVLKLTVTLNKQAYLAIVFASAIVLVFQMVVRPYRRIRIEECITVSLRERFFPEHIQDDIPNLLDNMFQVNLLVLFACILYSPGGFQAAFAISQLVANTMLAVIFIYHLLEYTPLGRILIEQMRRAKRKYNSWKEGRMLRAKAQKDVSQELATVQRVDLELCLEDCWNSDNEDDSEGGSADEHGSTSGDASNSQGLTNPPLHREEDINDLEELEAPLLIKSY